MSAKTTPRMRSPRVHAGSVADAFAAAKENNEPSLVPITFFADDRGWSIMNQFQGVLSAEGQINYSVMYPGIIKAWHRHEKQTDFWLCLHGHLKVGVHRESDDTRWTCVIGEKRPAVVIVPPPLWHGAATVGPEPAGLLYYVTHPYNASHPDEQRRAWNEPDDFPWTAQNR